MFFTKHTHADWFSEKASPQLAFMEKTKASRHLFMFDGFVKKPGVCVLFINAMLSNNWCGIVESFSMYSIWPIGKKQNSWFSTRHLGINHGKPQTPLLHYASGWSFSKTGCDEETNKTVEWSDEWTSDLRNKASSASENGRFLGHMCHEWRWIRSQCQR